MSRIRRLIHPSASRPRRLPIVVGTGLLTTAALLLVVPSIAALAADDDGDDASDAHRDVHVFRHGPRAEAKIRILRSGGDEASDGAERIVIEDGSRVTIDGSTITIVDEDGTTTLELGDLPRALAIPHLPHPPHPPHPPHAPALPDEVRFGIGIGAKVVIIDDDGARVEWSSGGDLPFGLAGDLAELVEELTGDAEALAEELGRDADDLERDAEEMAEELERAAEDLAEELSGAFDFDIDIDLGEVDGVLEKLGDKLERRMERLERNLERRFR